MYLREFAVKTVSAEGKGEIEKNDMRRAGWRPTKSPSGSVFSVSPPVLRRLLECWELVPVVHRRSPNRSEPTC